MNSTFNTAREAEPPVSSDLVTAGISSRGVSNHQVKMKSNERWTFIEGDKQRNEMSRIVRASDKDFLIAYVLTDSRNEEARKEDLQRGKLLASAPELLETLKTLATRMATESDRLSGAGVTATQAACDLIARVEGGAK